MRSRNRRRKATERRDRRGGFSGRHAACCLGLVSVIGCAAPRVQVSGPLLNVPGHTGYSSRSAPSPSRTTARSPATARPTSQASRSPENRPASPTRAASDQARDVARFVAQPNQLFNPPAPVRQWEYIVLHHSASGSGSLASIDQYHREVRGWDECGYHFVIGNGTESGDGEIEVGGRWLKQKHGAHTKHPDHPEYNDDGIGVCLVGNLDGTPPTPKQVVACRRLVGYLSERCQISPQHVATHADLVGQHTECPGRYFPYDRVVSGSRLAWLWEE